MHVCVCMVFGCMCGRFAHSSSTHRAVWHVTFCVGVERFILDILAWSLVRHQPAIQRIVVIVALIPRCRQICSWDMREVWCWEEKSLSSTKLIPEWKPRKMSECQSCQHSKHGSLPVVPLQGPSFGRRDDKILE